MHIAGKTGNVYCGATVMEDCEDVWVQGTADTTVSAETTSPPVGTKFVRGTTVTVGATTLLMYEDFVAKDITAYDAIYCWLRSSVTTAADDLQFLIDEGTGAAAPEETLSIPVLTANVWRRCLMPLTTPSALNAVQSVGLYQKTNLADGTFDVDDVEAIAEVDGIKSWTIDYNADALETTDFGAAGVKEYIIAGSGWSGSFEGYKDGVPLGIGSAIILALGESLTPGQQWIGDAFITGVSANVAHDGVVSYSYTFQGTGALEKASL
jgi:predicted secreted protein